MFTSTVFCSNVLFETARAPPPELSLPAYWMALPRLRRNVLFEMFTVTLAVLKTLTPKPLLPGFALAVSRNSLFATPRLSTLPPVSTMPQTFSRELKNSDPLTEEEPVRLSKRTFQTSGVSVPAVVGEPVGASARGDGPGGGDGGAGDQADRGPRGADGHVVQVQRAEARPDQRRSGGVAQPEAAHGVARAEDQVVAGAGDVHHGG